MFQKLYELSAIFIAKLLYYEISRFARTFHRQISTLNICCFTLSLSYHTKNSVCKFLSKNLLYLFPTFFIFSFYYKHHIYFFHFYNSFLSLHSRHNTVLNVTFAEKFVSSFYPYFAQK